MYIQERLRRGVDPDNIPETEQAMDFGAEEIERISREAAKSHQRCLDEIERLRTMPADLIGKLRPDDGDPFTAGWNAALNEVLQLYAERSDEQIDLISRS
jgi:hypothetical protein